MKVEGDLENFLVFQISTKEYFKEPNLETFEFLDVDQAFLRKHGQHGYFSYSLFRPHKLDTQSNKQFSVKHC